MKTFITFLILVFFHSILSAQQDWEIINTNITEPLHDVEFINDSVGFIYSYGTGNIYKTSDEGHSWTIIKKTDSIYFEQMQFIDSKTGWICGEYGRVLNTHDYGGTWTDQSISVTDKNLLLYGMYFINDSIGYLSGAAMGDKKLDPKFYITNDGGNSWNTIFEDIPHMILYIDQKEDYLFASGTGFIIKINIQTNSWKYSFRDTLKTVGQIRDIQFADDIFGLGCSFNGKILITTDGGDSFAYKEITTNRLRSIAYLGGNKWVVVGDNNKNDGATVYITNDNGENWEKIGDFPDIHRITLTEKNVWIVGKAGFIAKMRR